MNQDRFGYAAAFSFMATTAGSGLSSFMEHLVNFRKDSVVFL
jgi:hypothetical protein